MFWNTFKRLGGPILLLLVLFLGTVAHGSDVANTCNTHHGPQRESHTFGPFTIGGIQYTVTMESVLFGPSRSEGAGMHPESPSETLAYVCVQDGSGTRIWDRTFDVPDRAANSWTFGTAYEVQGETGAGIVLEFAAEALNRIPAGWITILVWRDRHLEVIAPDVRFYGMLEHIPDAGPDRRRLVSGDVIRYQFWTGNYYLLRGVRVNFEAGSVVPSCVHKCALPIMYQASLLEEDVTVQLFDRPGGRQNSLFVRRRSDIEFLDAFVEDISAIDAAGSKRDQRPVCLSPTATIKFWRS